MAVFFGLLAAPAILWAQTSRTSELRGGRWVEIELPATRPAVDPALLRIEQLIQDRKYSAAMKSAVAWLKRNPDSPVRDRALFLMAEALYHYGNRIKAFYYLDELLDTYPESPLYHQALERQYQIADAFLNGYKRRFLKIPMFGAEDEAIEMLYRIQQRAPGSPLAEKALLRTADYYYADAQYDLAEDAYAAYAKSYPRSPVLPRVRLRQAYSNLAQFRGLKFDATPVIDAKAQLQDIVRDYPDLAAQENIPAVLERIDNTFARKLAVTAEFYRRTRQPQAAAYTYSLLLKNYPDSTEAPRAQQILIQLGEASPATTQPGTQP
jgi:outer membrane assembly lipoprotein YfiO